MILLTQRKGNNPIYGETVSYGSSERLSPNWPAFMTWREKLRPICLRNRESNGAAAQRALFTVGKRRKVATGK